jgi:3-oxoacyl-[acyl-carrier protein] reductase
MYHRNAIPVGIEPENMPLYRSETIDILVNNAGVAYNKRLVDTSEQE